MTQSIGDMDNEDAKMSVEDLRVYTNDDQTYFVVFDLKYEGLDSNQVLVYVASAHVSDSNQIDHYELIATNTKLKKGMNDGYFGKISHFISSVKEMKSKIKQKYFRTKTQTYTKILMAFGFYFYRSSGKLCYQNQQMRIRNRQLKSRFLSMQERSQY